MSIQDKIATLEKVLNVILKISEIIVKVVTVVLEKLETVGE